ncbi:MAG TPA: hemerythrin domain-containing protein [Candidatus Thermoplasmatota archaeon]|nr:hemerythrin domain-containing protein [Candidatus Thermoplasmatota archaeon]
MDAIQLIKSDHVKVKGLFQEWMMAPSAQPERKRAVAEKIIQELMVHERIEEEIFYPAFKQALGEKGREEVEHSKKEHATVDSLIEELETMDVDAPDFEATMMELKEKLEHHIKDEEEKMLPLAQTWMQPQLAQLGKDMLEYKQALTTQVKPKPLQDGQRQQRQ